jgi:predicted dehydrogenase
LITLNCRVHVADINSGARSRASAKGASDVYANMDDLPACDGYVVAVPIPDLTRVCHGLLKHKSPIFSEKTLCLSMEDYLLLHDSGGSEFIFVMHKWHYHPGIEALRIVSESGLIGKIKELHATRHGWVSDFHGGDVFWTQAVHDLTIVKHILGHIPDKVRAVNVIKNEVGLPVAVTALLGAAPAVLLSVSGMHCKKVSGVAIHGSTGSAALLDAYDDHLLIRNGEGEQKISIDTTFPLYLELKEFVAYLHGGAKPRCNLQSAKEVTSSILNIRESANL